MPQNLADMRTVPIDVLATWPPPNYTNPVTRGPSAVILIIILSSFVLVAVSLRVYTRLWVQRWSGFDDLFMVLAVVRCYVPSIDSRSQNFARSVQSVSTRQSYWP